MLARPKRKDYPAVEMIASRLPGRPWQSRLVPYEDEILEMRQRRPPVPFAQIAAHLARRHRVKVHLDTIHNFVKVRTGLYRNCSRPQPSPTSKTHLPTKGTSADEWASLAADHRVLIPNSNRKTP